MNHRTFRGRFYLVVVFLSLFSFTAVFAGNSPVKIIKRVLMGSATEDMDYISKGAFANHLVLLDSYEVLAIPNGGLAANSVKKLFDLRALNLTANPRGLAYVEPLDVFAVNSLDDYGRILGLDINGNYKGGLTINYRNGYFPRHVEGLDFIPSTSSFYPDHFAMVTWDPYPYEGAPDRSRIQIFGLDGDVDAEIIPAAELDGTLFLGVVFLPPDRLLVSSLRALDEFGAQSDFYIFDLNGCLLVGPVRGPDTTSVEGMAITKTGAVACAGLEGVIRYVDQSLNPLPELERCYQPALGLRVLRSIAWNSTANEFIFNHWNTTTYNKPAFWEGVVVPSSLDSATSIVDFSAAGLANLRKFTYLPTERLFAASSRNPRSIVLLNEAGVQVGAIDLEPLMLGRPEALAYISSADQFVVSFLDVDPAKLRILSQTGALLRSIDLSTSGITSILGVEYFNPAHASGGQFLVATNDKKFLVTDFNGVVLKEISYLDDLGTMGTVMDVALITSGSDNGAFAATVEKGNNAGTEVILFELRK